MLEKQKDLNDKYRGFLTSTHFIFLRGNDLCWTLQKINKAKGAHWKIKENGSFGKGIAKKLDFGYVKLATQTKENPIIISQATWKKYA